MICGGQGTAAALDAEMTRRLGDEGVAARRSPKLMGGTDAVPVPGFAALGRGPCLVSARHHPDPLVAGVGDQQVACGVGGHAVGEPQLGLSGWAVVA